MENWEAMKEILSDDGIDNLSDEQIKQFTDDYDNHISMLHEMDSYQHDYSPSCDKCKSLESKLKELEKRNQVFENSVKQRRNCDHVWIEGDSVKYE